MLVLRSFALAALVLSLARPVAAQTTAPPNTPFVTSDFQLRVSQPVEGGGFAFITSDIELDRYFNRARCQCDSPIRIRADLTPAGSMKKTAQTIKGTVQIRIGGSDCVASNANTFQNAKCTVLQTVQLADLASAGTDVDTTVGALFRAPNVANGASCSVQFAQNVWLMIDASVDQMPDMEFADANAPKLGLYLDGQAPPAPSDVRVTPGNEALTVQWTKGGLVDDQSGYVVFCSRAGLPVFSKTFYTGNEFFTRESVCPASKTASAQTEWTYAASESPPATPLAAPDEFRRLDTRYVCSELLTGSTESRVKILQNGVPYVVGVAAVDKRGNASPITTAFLQTPIPTRDFYRGYREAGGEAEGGFCAFAERGRPAAWTLAALGVLALALARGRRR
jgi:hypothetical protein